MHSKAITKQEIPLIKSIKAPHKEKLTISLVLHHEKACQIRNTKRTFGHSHFFYLLNVYSFNIQVVQLEFS